MQTVLKCMKFILRRFMLERIGIGRCGIDFKYLRRNDQPRPTSASRLVPEMQEDLIPRNRHDPGTKAPLLSEFRHALIDLHKNLLGHLICLGGIAEMPPRQDTNIGLVKAQHCLKGFARVFASLFGELCFNRVAVRCQFPGIPIPAFEVMDVTLYSLLRSRECHSLSSRFVNLFVFTKSA